MWRLFAHEFGSVRRTEIMGEIDTEENQRIMLEILGSYFEENEDEWRWKGLSLLS